MDDKQWTTDNGQQQCILDNGKCSMDNGHSTMSNGHSKMDNERWTIDNEKSTMNLGQLNFFCDLHTEWNMFICVCGTIKHFFQL